MDPLSGAIQHYRHDPNDPASLANDTIPALHQDRAGRLWIATQGGGLDRFDPGSGQFTHFTVQSAGLSSNNISAIYEDQAGILWLGSGGLGVPGNGLSRFDPASGQVTQYLSDPQKPNTLSSPNITSLVQDAQGRLWIGTGGFTVNGAGLNRLDPQSGRIEHFQANPNDPNSLSNDNVLSLTIDSNGTLWVGTWGGGLERTDPLATIPHFIHARNQPFVSTSLSADIVWPVYEDRSGILWVGTVNGGLNKLNPQVQRFHLYRNDPGNPHSLGFDVVSSFYEDSHGALWVGTWGGGLDSFDPTTGRFTHYTHDPGDPGSLPDNTVGNIVETIDGSLWVGTFNGLARMDRKSGKFITYTNDPADPGSLANNNASTLLLDHSGRLWVGTLNGLDVFNPQSEKFTHLALPAGIHIVKLMLDSRGRIWVGTWEHGLLRLLPDTLSGSQVKFDRLTHDPQNTNSLGDDGVWEIHEDERGDFWFGTQNGLDHMDAQGNFHHYTENDGLPNSTVLCLLEDRDGLFWITTNNGLARFDPRQGIFRNFDARDGLQSNEFNSGACQGGREGRLYFGGIHGFNVFDPGEIQDNPVPPPVAITAMRIFNEPAKVDLSGQAPVQLSYQQNFIAFEFTGLDFHAPQKNRYAYKLDGVDRDWVQAGERRYASYTNLSGGSYTFRVKATNSDGVWNEMGVALPIQVTPPLWQTTTFRLTLAALLTVALLLVGRWRMQSVRAQNRRLEALAAQRTAELRQTNTRLQEEITQRQRAEEALMARTAEEAVTGERTRLARELHDAVTQTLFSASLIAEVLPELWHSDLPEAEKSTEELRQLTRGALAEMRTLLLELRPAVLTQTRFEDLLRQLCEALIGRARLPIALNVSGTRALPPEVQIALYRIAQESLNNIVKYAKASQVTIDLQMGAGGVHMVISDNGIGFDPATIKPNSLGQRIMRERAESIAAELEVCSAPGQGTQVTVIWTPEENEV